MNTAPKLPLSTRIATAVVALVATVATARSIDHMALTYDTHAASPAVAMASTTAKHI